MDHDNYKYNPCTSVAVDILQWLNHFIDSPYLIRYSFCDNSCVSTTYTLGIYGLFMEALPLHQIGLH